MRNVKTIPGEECVRQHRLLIADLAFAGTKRRRKTYVPKLKTWKLKDENLKQEIADKLKLQNTKNGKNDGVDGKWERMRDILLTTAQDVCGISRQPPRHKETWWWNEEVAKAVKNKREMFKNWQKNKTSQNGEHYREAKRNCKKSIAIAKKAKSQEFSDELDCEDGRRRVFRIAKQLARDGQDVVNVNCLKDKSGRVVIDNEEIKRIWKDYMEHLLNEENIWDREVDCSVKEGPECLISREEVDRALKKMKNGKAPGPSGVVTEMLKASGEVGVEWLTEKCKSVIRERKIPEDWKKSVILPIFKGKGDPLECGSYRAIKLLEHGMKVLE